MTKLVYSQVHDKYMHDKYIHDKYIDGFMTSISMMKYIRRCTGVCEQETSQCAISKLKRGN